VADINDSLLVPHSELLGMLSVQSHSAAIVPHVWEQSFYYLVLIIAIILIDVIEEKTCNLTNVKQPHQANIAKPC
jgi:protein-S-isoprenylcysteine O-methyltransferase Ste14